MVQVKEFCNNTGDVNHWLRNNDEHITVIDVKFTTTDSGYSRFLVIYDTNDLDWMKPQFFDNNKRNNIEFDDYNVALNS
jgi:hypothetical protein